MDSCFKFIEKWCRDCDKSSRESMGHMVENSWQCEKCFQIEKFESDRFLTHAEIKDCVNEMRKELDYKIMIELQ